jgi:hypothetical protein
MRRQPPRNTAGVCGARHLGSIHDVYFWESARRFGLDDTSRSEAYLKRSDEGKSVVAMGYVEGVEEDGFRFCTTLVENFRGLRKRFEGNARDVRKISPGVYPEPRRRGRNDNSPLSLRPLRLCGRYSDSFGCGFAAAGVWVNVSA